MSIVVSVIIPMYNAERHLEECLNSCLKQTLEPIEIICINDGSTDGTEKILERYEREHSNIVILNQKNQGSGMARNLGIECANGEFVAFMDSDDYYPDRDALKKLYDAAVRENVLVCGGSVLFLKDGKIDRSNDQYCFQENKKMCYREYQEGGGFWSFIYNTQFLKNNKLIFPAYRRYQDSPFFVEVMVKAEEFYVIRDCVYMYRMTDKLVPFNRPDIVIGIVNGVFDILKISRENHLEKLHTNMVLFLKESVLVYIYKLIYCKNTSVRKYYEKTLSEIDETLLEQDGRKVEKPKWLSDDKMCHMVEQSLQKERLLLDKINSYEKVLIYGAGGGGRILYDYIRRRGCTVDIDFMVSTENPDYTACGKRVKSIKDCLDKKDDALVLIANKYGSGQMEETAHNYYFKNIETISYEELLLFGADMEGEKSIVTF